MLLSECFGIHRGDDEDWFDPVLSVDTPLFIDPFLLYAQEEGVFAGSHAEIIAFFNHAFGLIAQSGGNPESTHYRCAVGMLRLPEVHELCLGFTHGGTRGSGSGREIAEVIAAALWEAVEAGVQEITHFEETGILSEGIGADRISDATAGMLRRRLAQYTESACARHGIPTREARYARGFYDIQSQAWCPFSANLPVSPYGNKPVLLVPRAFLRALPTVNADDFWEYCYYNENDILRAEYSRDVTRNVRKAEIIDFARRHPEIRRRYLDRLEGVPPVSYDFDADPGGYVKWVEATRGYCRNTPIPLAVDSQEQFLAVVDRMIQQYRHFVVENQGWRLLWNDKGTPRRETAAQLLMLGVVKHYCSANNIDVTREPDIGRGPVDFKVSQGYALRVLIEVKLAKNTRFWAGLRRQLPTYLRAEQVNRGYFVVIILTEQDAKKTSEIQEVVSALNSSTGCEIRAVLVDARPDKPSASRL